MARTRICEGCEHSLSSHSYGRCFAFVAKRLCECVQVPTADQIERECNASCRASITSRKKCHCVCGGTLHGSEYSDATLIALNQ